MVVYGTYAVVLGHKDSSPLRAAGFFTATARRIGTLTAVRRRRSSGVRTMERFHLQEIFKAEHAALASIS
jgi:hypothetical protein